MCRSEYVRQPNANRRGQKGTRGREMRDEEQMKRSEKAEVRPPGSRERAPKDARRNRDAGERERREM